MAGGLITNYLNHGAGAPSTAPSIPSGEIAFYLNDTTGDVYVWKQGASAWALVTGGGGGSLTSANAQLGANVTMTSSGTYYDGPSVSLAAGTWMVTGILLCSHINNTGFITSKLWDGTTAYASSEHYEDTVGGVHTHTLVAIVTPTGTTTYKLSAASTVASNVILAAANNNGAGNNASSIVALKIA